MNDEKKKLYTNLSLDEIEKMFPFTLDDKTNVYLDNIINNEFKSKARYLLYDDFGFKYNIPYKSLILMFNTKKHHGYFKSSNRSIKINNLETFMRLHNINCKIVNIGGFTSLNEEITLQFQNELFITEIRNIVYHPIMFTKDGFDQYKHYKKAMTISKESAINLIIQKQELLGRPLAMADLLCNSNDDNIVGISVVIKYWGNFQNMLKSTNLYDIFFQSHDLSEVIKIASKAKDDGHLRVFLSNCPLEWGIELVRIVCERVKNKGYNQIAKKDFELDGFPISYSSLERMFNKYNINIEDIINSFGLVNVGRGAGKSYKFSDGEKIDPRIEYLFSSILRSYNYVYNVDYYKNVRYSNFINTYIGNKTCDYLLVNGNCKLYIEIAGMLTNKKDIESFYNNKEIDTYIKERYRKSLLEKQKMLTENRLDYLFIYIQSGL